MTITSYKRKTRKHSTIDSLSEAQKIAFAPLTFCAINTLLEAGILKALDENKDTVQNLISKLNLNEYMVKTLLEVGEAVGVIEKEGEFYSTTLLAKNFLYDKMTIANFNFVRDCCYLGASELTQSFLQNKPVGFKKFFKDKDVLYPELPSMPENFKKSWYEFDHYYSDNCFDLIYKIISDKNFNKIFDIGANTGKFEKVCLKNNPNMDITMLDLKENIDIVSKDKDLKACKFYPINILDTSKELLNFEGAIIMSQFLDCFSKEQIELILKRIKKASKKGTVVYILEPFIDNQIYEAAKLALVHTSLYFTSMANGNSKMYSKKEMLEIIEKADLQVLNTYFPFGIHDYTLLECLV